MASPLLEKRTGRTYASWLGGQLGILVAIVALSALFQITSGGIFLRVGNLVSNILSQVPALILLAIGEAYAVLVGGIDLSIGSQMAVVSVAACVAALAVGGWAGVLVGLVVAVVFGVLMGGFNGLFIARLRIPPFIQTVGMLSALKGLALWYTGAVPIQGMQPEWQVIGSAFVGPAGFKIPIAILVAAGVLALNALLLNHTRFGRYLYAIGGNEEAAYTSGIDVVKYKNLAYVMGGINIALAAFVLSSRVNAGIPTLGEGMEMDAIAAVVLGGIAIGGGSGRIGGVFLGGLLLAILRNGLNLSGINTYIQMVIIGTIIIGAVYLDRLRKQRA